MSGPSGVQQSLGIRGGGDLGGGGRDGGGGGGGGGGRFSVLVGGHICVNIWCIWRTVWCLKL